MHSDNRPPAVMFDLLDALEAPNYVTERWSVLCRARKSLLIKPSVLKNPSKIDNLKVL